VYLTVDRVAVSLAMIVSVVRVFCVCSNKNSARFWSTAFYYQLLVEIRMRWSIYKRRGKQGQNGWAVAGSPLMRSASSRRKL
jgi:hypothetical protein